MPEAPAAPPRPGREAVRKRRSRAVRIGAVVIVVLLVLGAGAGVFFLVRDSDGDDSASTTTTEAQEPAPTVTLEIGGVSNENGGPPAELAADQQRQILDLVGRYIDEGLIAPVVTGEAPGQSTLALFELAPAIQLEAGDAAVVYEEGLPALDGSFRPRARPVQMTALSDQLGFVVLVTAQVAYTATAETERGDIKIDRFFELTFAPVDGDWKITGYDVTLSRTKVTPTGSTTTTTAEAAAA
jgi:hypothetical protein